MFNLFYVSIVKAWVIPDMSVIYCLQLFDVETNLTLSSWWIRMAFLVYNSLILFSRYWNLSSIIHRLVSLWLLLLLFRQVVTFHFNEGKYSSFHFKCKMFCCVLFFFFELQYKKKPTNSWNVVHLMFLNMVVILV